MVGRAKCQGCRGEGVVHLGSVLLWEPRGLLPAVGRARGSPGSLSAGLCLFALAPPGINPVRLATLVLFCGALLVVAS